MIVATSVTPILIKLRLTSIKNYDQNFTLITCGLVATFILLSLMVTLLAHPIIHVLYGSLYQEAASVLIVHIWSGVFVCLSVMGGQWLIIENFPLLHLYRSIFGAIVNILANLLLIPWLGIVGAAIATLIAQISASFLFDSRTRKIFWIKLKSLNLFYTIRLLKNKIKASI